MTRREIAQAARLYRSGLTLPEVAQALGYSPGADRYLARRPGVQPRRRGPRGRTDVSDETIVALRSGGWTWPAVAAEVGMSRTGVRARHLRATTGARWR